MTSKTEKAGNVCRLPRNLAQLKGVGFKVVFEHAGHHYRLTNKHGAQFDWWASTMVWMRVADRHPGDGLPTLLEQADFQHTTPAPADAVERVSLTIIADASWITRGGCGGWGVWMAGAGLERAHMASGPIEQKLDGAADAEVFALGMAVHIAHKKGLLKPGVVVLLQSDCLGALSKIRGVTGASDRPAPGGLRVTEPRRGIARMSKEPPLAFIQKVQQETGVVLHVRHVKGHVPGGKGRFWCNAQVDGLAKKAAKALMQRKAAERKNLCPNP